MRSLRVAFCITLILVCLNSVSLGGQRASSSQAGSSQSGKSQTGGQTNTVTVSDSSLKTAHDQGLPLTTVSNVSDQTSVEAVLIPASLARRIFGKEVANNYAVIELTVSNKDSKAALIIQSVFLDYSQWLLSGLSQRLPASPQLESTQKANQPWQVASVESRLVRGELLDAQQWTARNWTIRSLTAVGTVAAAFQFPFSGDVGKGIAAFAGSVVPGASTLWPDGTVNQINRISDVGFRTNTVIPKQASDILVAFFPIDRFLTPTFRKLFLKNPSGFFVPGELLADPQTRDKMSALLLPMFTQINSNISDQKALAGATTVAFLADCPSVGAANGSTSVPGNASNSTPGTNVGAATNNANSGSSVQLTGNQACQIQDLMNRVSLNSVRVVVGGVMTVDVATVPATIQSVTFKQTDATKLWSTYNVKQQGTITGVYLSGGTPYIVDRSNVPIPDITVEKVTANSSDSKLVFNMTLAKCISAAPQSVFLVVAKDNGNSGSSDTSSSDSGDKNSSDQNSSNQGSSQSSDSPVSGVLSMPFQLQPSLPACTDTASQGSSSRIDAGGPNLREQCRLRHTQSLNHRHAEKVTEAFG